PYTPVKEFSRPAAGRQTDLSDLRPPHVLLKTMEYLIGDVLDRKDFPWKIIYNFIFDRIRAIRQDMVIQRVADETAVSILEQATRFHILSHHKLAGMPIEDFDPKINGIHTTECLKRLLVLYKHVFSRNRPEFESYYLLCNLDNTNALIHGLQLPKSVRVEVNYQLSWKLALAYLHGNYVLFIRLLHRLPRLSLFAVVSYVRDMRIRALDVMNTAYSSQQCMFPIADLNTILGFEESEIKEFLAAHGLPVTS
ncbi:predicted protein, partial [Nematostella vectensis]